MTGPAGIGAQRSGPLRVSIETDTPEPTTHMNGLAWTMLVLAAMIGAFLFATIGAVLLALLLASVSNRLTRHDEHRDY